MYFTKERDQLIIDYFDNFDNESRGVNDTLLPIYPIRTVFDKMGMDKKNSVKLFDMDKGKNFISLSKWIRVWVRSFRTRLPYRVNY
jgi:hypothetical protein